MRGFRVIGAVGDALLFLVISLLTAVPSFGAEQNLLLNGDLEAGLSDTPEHWTRTPGAPSDSFKWSHGHGEPAMLEIATVKDGLPRTPYWTQSVNLAQPGWYYLSADVKTEAFGTSAAIRVKVMYAADGAVQNNADWRPMEVYFEVARPNETVQIGFGVRATSTGRAFFRDLKLNHIAGSPPPGSRQLDIASKLGGFDSQRFSQLFPEKGDRKDQGTSFLDTFTDFALMSNRERVALVGVANAKPPPDEKLWRDLLKSRVAVALLFILALLTFLDRRFSTNRSSGDMSWTRLREDRDLRKSVAVAALLCLALLATWLVTRVEYVPGHGFYVVEPRAIGGDEPHYLIMINSLLFKHNLHVESVYDDVEYGGPEAGVMSRGIKIDRHTIAVNRRTGHRAIGIFRDRSWHRNPAPEFAPSPDVYEIPVHPSAFPILMAMAIAPMQPGASEVEPDVGFILMLISWLGVVVTYFVGRQVGMGRRWAMLAASMLFAASPWLAYSRSYFSETTSGVALILGLWMFLSDLSILAALAAAVGAIMKPPFALVAAAFLVEKVREKRWKDAIKIALVSGLPVSAIFAYNFWLHRRFLVLSVEASFQFRRLVDTLVDPIEGLLLYAPWTVFGFLACARAFLSRSEDSRLARTMALPLFLYLIVLSSIGFGAGYCFGPRYWVAFLPWLALGSVEEMRRAGGNQRLICAVLVLFGVAIAIPDALRYPQLFERPILDAWRGFY
jgi:hypothetical protein